jgi:hypothetical protein
MRRTWGLSAATILAYDKSLLMTEPAPYGAPVADSRYQASMSHKKPRTVGAFCCPLSEHSNVRDTLLQHRVPATSIFTLLAVTAGDCSHAHICQLRQLIAPGIHHSEIVDLHLALLAQIGL